jgi:hypothetical protein
MNLKKAFLYSLTFEINGTQKAVHNDAKANIMRSVYSNYTR